MTALARRARQRASDRGFTLVEVLVAMTILMMVIGLSTRLLIGAIDQQSNNTQQSDAQNRNDTGMELATRLLRQAVYPYGGSSVSGQTIISAATATSVTFTSRQTSTGSAVANCTSTSCTTTSTASPVTAYTIALTGTTLYWGSAAEIHPCSSVCTYGTPNPNQAMVFGVQNAGGTTSCPNNTTGTPVFHYYTLDQFGNTQELTAPVTGATALGSIQFIEIDLYTQTQTGPQRPACVALTDRVELRNR
jgi:prepilin-type N-terminal cleavage/methylation domain-containing protein